LNLYNYIVEIEEITMKAEKKFSLTQNLKKMKDEMKIFNLEQKRHEKNNVLITYLLKGYDDVNAKLDDQIVTT